MLPVKKISKTRTRTRRAHQALRAPALVRCRKCSHVKLPHAACSNCGYVSPAVALRIDEEES